MMNAPALVVMDLAGTTVKDDGVVEDAFAAAYAETTVMHGYGDVEAVRAYARETMGQSKIDVFRVLAGDGAEEANAAFERAYDRLIAEGACTAIPGAEDTIRVLKDAGIPVVLTTGFSEPTKNALLDSLGWQELPTLSLSPAHPVRGRPAPDLNLVAVIRTATRAVADIAVVGDTVSDMQAGVRAGAGRVVGVLTGAHDEAALREAGATDVIASVAGLPELLGLSPASR